MEMSDPVTNVEIEDVLSSIRRLVSEDSRPKFDRQAIEKHDENPEDAHGVQPAVALVLTPALRVSEVQEPAETSDETGQDMAETQPENHDDSDAIAEDENTDTSVGDSPEWAENESHDDSVEVAESDENGVDQHRHEDAEHGDLVADTLEFDANDDVEDSEVEGPYDHLSLETRIAEVEDAVADQDDQWEPDGEDQGDNAAEPVESLQWEDHVDASVDERGDDYVNEPDHVQDFDQKQDHWHDHVNDEPDETGIEDALPQDTGTQDAVSEGVTEDVIEADEYDFDAVDDETPETFDVDDTQFETQQENPDVDLFGADDAILDEDMLREMVSEIVRQELQGALGERITRNVRKLVRREIHRALASQELD